MRHACLPPAVLQGYLSVFALGQYVEESQLIPEAPRITEKHREAFRALQEIAQRPEFHLSRDLQPGDIQV